MLVAKDVSEKLNINEAFNIVINNGEQAGQTVFHSHIHLLAGKTFQTCFLVKIVLLKLFFCEYFFESSNNTSFISKDYLIEIRLLLTETLPHQIFLSK